jgi:AdoMet-dependent heme synthase
VVHPAAPHAFDFERAPFLVVWEVTRACALACVHCRADAIARRDPGQLTTTEGIALIDEIRGFGVRPPLLVLTGGDPMLRHDLAELVGYASRAGLSVALTPSGTAAATRRRLEELRDAGLRRVAVSLDGPDAETHDAFRGVRGSYQWTMRIIDAVRELDLPLQINTTISALTLPDFPAMVRRVSELPLVLWAVFFLVKTGRGAALDQIDAHECEDVLERLDELSSTAPFGIKTTEAPHYHRVMRQRQPHRVKTPPSGTRPDPRAAIRAPRSVTDGNGFVFVDHRGDICPSGFLPLACGNVRRDSLVRVYREHELFVRLRDSDALEGKCGRCEFRGICGGSRARAYEATGSAFGSDPLCAYEPGLTASL